MATPTPQILPANSTKNGPSILSRTRSQSWGKARGKALPNVVGTEEGSVLKAVSTEGKKVLVLELGNGAIVKFEERMEAAERWKEEIEAAWRRWITVYPIYFDLKRPHKKGQRRVPNEKAVIYPLAQDIANAASRLGFRVVLEADKTHPADWANPGRVRIMLKNETTGKPTNPRIPNRSQLLLRIAPILQDTAAIPTPKVQPGEEVFTDELKKQMSELPIEKKLPRHSPAVSTGFIDRMMGFGGEKGGKEEKGKGTKVKG
ncbi:signal recognition particle, SRP19 subunit [Atractiella rhizophila]|nr:signal recognition particle, SRP19 subunit [Atractiella rhizophila]